MSPLDSARLYLEWDSSSVAHVQATENLTPKSFWIMRDQGLFSRLSPWANLVWASTRRVTEITTGSPDGGRPAGRSGSIVVQPLGWLGLPGISAPSSSASDCAAGAAVAAAAAVGAAAGGAAVAAAAGAAVAAGATGAAVLAVDAGGVVPPQAANTAETPTVPLSCRNCRLDRRLRSFIDLLPFALNGGYGQSEDIYTDNILVYLDCCSSMAASFLA